MRGKTDALRSTRSQKLLDTHPDFRYRRVNVSSLDVWLCASCMRTYRFIYTSKFWPLFLCFLYYIVFMQGIVVYINVFLMCSHLYTIAQAHIIRGSYLTWFPITWCPLSLYKDFILLFLKKKNLKEGRCLLFREHIQISL